MKLEIMKDYKWSINFKAVSFNKGDKVDVNNVDANEMISAGYAKPVVIGRPKKETLVEETKIVIPKENKEIDEKEAKKTTRKKKYK